MKIVNVIPETYQEFYDHLSLVLFCYNCNLHCSYCHNYAYISDIKNVCLETAEQLIDKHYHPLIDGLVFLGGEATLYPERMKEIALYAKQKYKLDTKLFTNGTNPQIVLEGLRDNWLDFVSIDFKSMSETIYVKGHSPHDTVMDLLKSISLEQFNNRVEVRTTVFKEMSKKELNQIKDYCEKLNLTHLTQTEFLVESS
jgi:pyruvate-formate lyase-activating enzyme